MLNPEFGDLDLSLVLDDHFFSEPSNNEHEMSSNHNNTTSAMIIPPLTQQQLINPTTTTTTTTASINPFDYFAQQQQQQQLYHFQQQQQQQQQQQITQQQQQVAAAAAVAFDAYMANQYNALSSLYSVQQQQQQQQVPSFHPHQQQQHHSIMNNTMYGISPSMMILNNNNESSPSPTNSTTSSSSGSMGGEQQGLTDISDASNHSHHTPSPTTTSSTTTLSPRYHHHLHHQQECSESEDACGTTTARPSKRKKHKREPQEIDEDTREYERLSLIPNSQLSTEDKKRKKQLRNRLSAQQSRQRKNTLLQSALDENHELKKHNETLENDNRILKLRVKQLEDTNDHLEQKNKQLEKELKEYRVTDLMNTGSSSTPTHGTAVNDDDVMLEENVQDLFMRPLSPSHSGLMDHLFDFSGTSTTSSSATMRSTTKMYMLVFLVACACIFFGFNTLLTRYDMNKRSANQLNHASPRMRLLQVNHSGPSGQVSPLPSSSESSSSSVSSSMNESYENIIVDSYVPRRRASAKRLPMEFNGHLMSEQKVYVPAELNQQYMTEEMLHSVIHHMDVDAASPNAIHEEKDEFVQDVHVDETNQQEEQPSELILTNNQQSKLALVERTNAKQLSLIPLALSTRDSNNFLFKHLKDDAYQQGYLYQLPDDSGSNQSNNTVRLFCPQIFPMITQTSTVEGGQNLSQTIEDAMSSKGCIKFVVPIGSEQFIDKDGIAVRVVRLAEISASDIKLTDSYLSLRSDEQPIVVPAEPLSSSGL